MRDRVEAVDEVFVIIGRTLFETDHHAAVFVRQRGRGNGRVGKSFRFNGREGAFFEYFGKPFFDGRIVVGEHYIMRGIIFRFIESNAFDSVGLDKVRRRVSRIKIFVYF